MSVGDYFLRVLMFDVFADWPQTQNFVLANISFMHYGTLEFVDPVPYPRTNRKI